MRFLHCADLHFGKRVHKRSMLDEQEHAAEQLIRIAGEQKVDAVLVAGDVFDRANPGASAIDLAGRFFAGLVAQGIPVFAIPGNHDNAALLAYCSAVTAQAGLHIAGPYAGEVESFELADEYGPVAIHLLPFIRPMDVRVKHPHRADEVKSHHDAVRVALEEHAMDGSVRNVRNVLVAHQFVTAGAAEPERCESETMGAVGGLDNVDAGLFDAFCYVALGHLHGPQRVGRDSIRYAGSPVKYSFSEINHVKAACIVDVDGEGAVELRQIPLHPLHGMREVTLSIEEVEAGADAGCREDYLHVTLTDRSAYDALNRVRAVYPNLLCLSWQEAETQVSARAVSLGEMERKTPLELFGDFFRDQTGADMDDEQRDLAARIMIDGEDARVDSRAAADGEGASPDGDAAHSDGEGAGPDGDAAHSDGDAVRPNDVEGGER